MENRMNGIKAASAAAVILSAAIAAPVFAQDAGVYGAPEGYRAAPVAPQSYYRSDEQTDPEFLPPRDNEEYWNLQNFGRTGRSPSRVGGESPSLKPPS
jgi:hypothetical protein